ncbi:MAG: type II secretion system protein GspD [Deltaproteobacteria bacterium]|nr:type II secretion system protein GspD [Deltaproteobacteria bacterium]
MMPSDVGFMKKLKKLAWLPGLALIFLLPGFMGCAGPAQVAAPPGPPPSRRVPVTVTTPPVKPKAAKPEKKPDPEMDDRVLESYTAALKKVPPAPRKTPPPGEKVFPIDLNLKNADLVEAIRVLAETMGLNYSIDPKVKGTVNVRASGKLTQSELLTIMETLLNVNGATMVQMDKVYKIVPLDKAATQPVPVYIKGEVPPGMRAQVVFLEQTGAKEMVPVLKPLMSTGGSITEASHNALVLVDTPDNLDKLLKLIHLVDTRALAQTLVRLVKVHNTDPHEIIGELETIFTAYGTLAGKEKGKFGVSFLSVGRLTSVMILATSGSLMERAVYWVKQLDSRTDILANVHVYHVENYKAKNLANLLTQVYGGQPAAPTIKEVKPETGAPFSTGIGGPRGTGMGGVGGMGTGGLGTSRMTGVGGGPESQTIPPAPGEPGAPGAMAPRERAVPGAPGAAPTGVSPKEGVRIIPDEENNLLVVVAPPHEWNVISRILKSLDIMPRQVLNEVLIAEVNLTDDLSYGIQFALGAKATETKDTDGTTTPAPFFSGLTGLEIVSPAAAVFAAAQGFSFIVSDTANQFKALINLLASQGRAEILASPQIMAANNQEARIQIGEDVPIKTSESTPLLGGTTLFSTSTVQYRSTGIILAVKPQINAKGLVTLEITQEVSNALPVQIGETSPRISIRQAKTSLTTGDNQTIVLGGLIREDKTVDDSGAPGLRRIPLIGSLFGAYRTSKRKTELLVLITPHIVRNMEEGARVTRELKDKVGLEELPKKPPPPGK